jgi:hypothetical protein
VQSALQSRSVNESQPVLSEVSCGFKRNHWLDWAEDDAGQISEGADKHSKINDIGSSRRLRTTLSEVWGTPESELIPFPATGSPQDESPGSRTATTEKPVA